MRPAPYQEVAIERLVDHETYGCFDPAGAGKTAVAINAALELEQWPLIVTAPAHLIPQWQGELEAWGIPPEQIAACPRGTNASWKHEAIYGDAAVKVVSYNAWASDRYINGLLDHGNGMYVFDESQRLRKGNPHKGQSWKGVKRLRTKTRSGHLHTPVWWLSGTPLVKDATDLWPFLAMCQPFVYTSREQFAREMCKTWMTDYGMRVGRLLNPPRFQRLLGRWSIKRSWEDIPELASLESIVTDVPLTLLPAERSRIRHIKQHHRDPETGEGLWSASATIRALRRISMPAKLEAASELVQDHSGRFLAVAWYRSSATDLANTLERQRRRHVSYIDGSTKEHERQRAYRAYRRDPEHIIVGTIGALREGLNLQSGHQVLFAEDHYLSADNDQTISRVLRRGQTRPVNVYRLYVKGSFDVKVRATARKRSAMIEDALEEYLAED